MNEKKPQAIGDVLRVSATAGLPRAPARVPVVGDVLRDIKFRDVVVTVASVTPERVIMTNGSTEPHYLFHRIYEFEDGTPVAPLTEMPVQP